MKRDTTQHEDEEGLVLERRYRRYRPRSTEIVGLSGIACIGIARDLVLYKNVIDEASTILGADIVTSAGSVMVKCRPVLRQYDSSTHAQQYESVMAAPL